MKLAEPEVSLDGIDLDAEPQCEWVEDPEDESTRCPEDATQRIIWIVTCPHLKRSHVACDEHASKCHVGERYRCGICGSTSTITSITAL